MSGSRRTGAPAKKSLMRPPIARPPNGRTLSAAPVLNGRVSPADSVTSMAASKTRSPTHGVGTKRKERDFEQDGGEETNINVVVRCRGRNDREVKENSGVVVSTDGIKGSSVELSMGPSALSNKTYHFDKVFSPAADQGIIFDEVVTPILDEVLLGFNCTIFAYGQTGTGKTYTMSGDISDTLPIPDASGIIPRALHSLFDKLENSATESSVKCSFIELYNEELKDLLSADENVKLKIYEDANRKRSHATLIQGVEESHIKTASKGIELLRVGSHKRQVAATKCNDLSSRSHTVFTITIYMKRTAEGGEDFISVGKLNLVDLAGSENIQRSGAENKRAAEAGLINKSLLTLGRVINALVDKGSHIPYRESKLTRLLQDSLGGRTKTCIIATLSPAKSNLEETISTLDYAFRAKNIRNKPQMNQLVSKKTLIREFTAEIEKLKSELIATRQRNGVYLTAETYDELTTESESRRILSEEQRDKIETMEANLRNKVHDLFTVTSNFNNLKKDNEAVKLVLDGTKDLLEKTETVLAHTRKNLEEEITLRKAHQDTEEDLVNIGNDLISTLGKTTSDIGGLRSKIRRRSELQSLNRTNWTASQVQVSDTTSLMEHRLTDFEVQHGRMITELSLRVQEFVKYELSKAQDSMVFLQDKSSTFDKSEAEVNEQTSQARDQMNGVLEEIKTLREEVKQKVGDGLDGLSSAAQRISAGVITELEAFHGQLHSSYSSLGKEFRTTYDELVKRLNAQRTEADDLRWQLSEASGALVKANVSASERLNAVLVEEKEQRAKDRLTLLSQITSLVQDFDTSQEDRFESKLNTVQRDIAGYNQTFQQRQNEYDTSMDEWLAKEDSLVGDILKSREAVKSKIKKDWTSANTHNSNIQATTRSVHEETVRIVDAQMEHMDVQLQALDEILSRVRDQNGRHHESHVQSLQGLADTVKQSYTSIGDHLTESSERTNGFGDSVNAQAASLIANLQPLNQDIQTSLAGLRADIMATTLTEYVPTGQTPQKLSYQYLTTLPRTEPHDVLLHRIRNPPVPQTSSPAKKSNMLTEISSPDTAAISPSKAMIFTDTNVQTTRVPLSDPASPILTRKNSRPASAHGGLRELDVNVASTALTLEPNPAGAAQKHHAPLLKPLTSVAAPPHQASMVVDEKTGLSASIGPGSKLPKRALAEGRENMPFSVSVGAGGGRNLRSRGS